MVIEQDAAGDLSLRGSGLGYRRHQDLMQAVRLIFEDPALLCSFSRHNICLSWAWYDLLAPRFGIRYSTGALS